MQVLCQLTFSMTPALCTQPPVTTDGVQQGTQLLNVRGQCFYHQQLRVSDRAAPLLLGEQKRCRCESGRKAPRCSVHLQPSFVQAV